MSADVGDALLRFHLASGLGLRGEREDSCVLPLRYSIVDGMNVRDSRMHNYPPRWNAAPSQDLLVIRRNHKTGALNVHER
jgi:hypothetical protein